MELISLPINITNSSHSNCVNYFERETIKIHQFSQPHNFDFIDQVSVTIPIPINSTRCRKTLAKSLAFS